MALQKLLLEDPILKALDNRQKDLSKNFDRFISDYVLVDKPPTENQLTYPLTISTPFSILFDTHYKGSKRFIGVRSPKAKVMQTDVHIFYPETKTRTHEIKYTWYKHVYDPSRPAFKSTLQPIPVVVKA